MRQAGNLNLEGKVPEYIEKLEGALYESAPSKVGHLDHLCIARSVFKTTFLALQAAGQICIGNHARNWDTKRDDHYHPMRLLFAMQQGQYGDLATLEHRLQEVARGMVGSD